MGKLVEKQGRKAKDLRKTMVAGCNLYSNALCVFFAWGILFFLGRMNMTSNYEFKRFITSQQLVTNELIKLIDLHDMGEINSEYFEDNIIKYVHFYTDLLTENCESDLFMLRGTPQIKLGKKRIKVIASCLENKKIAKLVNLEKGIFKAIK